MQFLILSFLNMSVSLAYISWQLALQYWLQGTPHPLLLGGSLFFGGGGISEGEEGPNPEISIEIEEEDPPEISMLEEDIPQEASAVAPHWQAWMRHCLA